MKKALIITSVGGFFSQFLRGDAEILAELGYEIHLASNFDYKVYPFDPDKLRAEGIHLHQIGMYKKPWHLAANLRALTDLIRLIRRERIDLIHCHNPVGGFLGRLAGRFSGMDPKVIYTAHGFHFFKGSGLPAWMLIYPVESLLARMTDALVTINHEDETRAGHFRLRSGGRVYRIPGVGYDPARFHPGSDDAGPAIRDALDIPHDAFHIVTAAELNRNKNQMAVIRALEQLDDPGIIYSICGRGPYKRKLMHYVQRHGLRDRVRFQGYRKDMEKVLRSADCFAFPSIREGFGIAAVEALASGVPVVASDNRGTREYMTDDMNGIVCRSNDPAEYADAFRRLKSDVSLRERMSGNAVRSAGQFTQDSAMSVMRRVYGDVSTGR